MFLSLSPLGGGSVDRTPRKSRFKTARTRHFNKGLEQETLGGLALFCVLSHHASSTSRIGGSLSLDGAQLPTSCLFLEIRLRSVQIQKSIVMPVVGLFATILLRKSSMTRTISIGGKSNLTKSQCWIHAHELPVFSIKQSKRRQLRMIDAAQRPAPSILNEATFLASRRHN